MAPTSHLASKTNERSQRVRMRATGSISTRGSYVEGKTILAETWLMEVEMQLHPFMLGIDVARRALLIISAPPFRYFRRGEACAKDNNFYPVWSDDTIWKMPGQLCYGQTPIYCMIAYPP